MDTDDRKSIRLTLAFDAEDYATWAFKFEQWMQWRCLWRVFVEDPPLHMEGEEKEVKWRLEYAQGYAALTLVLGEDELTAVMEFKDKACSAKLAWEKLRDRCVQKSHLHRLEVRNRLADLRMADGESLERYLTLCDGVCRAHREFSVELNEMDYIWAVLRGFPPDWSLVIMSLQPNQEEWTVDNVFMRLRQEELRRTMIHKEEWVLVTGKGNAPRPQQHTCWNGRVSKRDEQVWQEEKSEELQRVHGMQPRGVCHYCKKHGHKWRYCKSRPSNWIPPFLRENHEEVNEEDDSSPPTYAM